jgi:hypothetical protein
MENVLAVAIAAAKLPVHVPFIISAITHVEWCGVGVRGHGRTD